MAVDLDKLEFCSVAELVALVKQLLQRVETIEAENVSLKDQLFASRGATAPISKGEPDFAPKRRGLLAGGGRFEGRAMPVMGPVDMVGVIRALLESPESLCCGISRDMVERTASVDGGLARPVRSNRFFRVEHCSCVERGLLGALNARRLPHCSKNEGGAWVYEAVKRVITTLSLRGGTPSSGLSPNSSRPWHYRLWLADQSPRAA